MVKRKSKPPPPIARDEGKSKVSPIFATLDAAVRIAEDRFKQCNDLGFLRDVDKIPRAGLYQSYVVTAARDCPAN